MDYISWWFMIKVGVTTTLIYAFFFTLAFGLVALMAKAQNGAARFVSRLFRKKS